MNYIYLKVWYLLQLVWARIHKGSQDQTQQKIKIFYYLSYHGNIGIHVKPPKAKTSMVQFSSGYTVVTNLSYFKI